MSLRLRLLIATGVALLAGVVLIDVVTYVVVTRSQLAQVDEALQRAHSPVEQLASTGDPNSWSLIPEIAPGLYVAIIDGRGIPVFGVPAREPGREDIEVDVDDIVIGREVQTLSASDGDEMRLRIDELPGGSTLVIGQSLHEVTDSRNRLLVVLLITSGGAIAAVVLLSWWLIRLGLRPLKDVETSAEEISEHELGEHRVPGGDQATEVGSLARALNAMLDRLDAARSDRERTLEELRASETRMRRFIADASHELRTPIAATAAYAELFGKGASDHPADLDRSMRGIEVETARMSGLVDDLLLLARLDERRPLAIERVDLTEIVLSALDAARALEPTRHFATRIDAVVLVSGDAGRLRQVVDNLLANVRTHTPVEAGCEVSLKTDAGWAILEVGDAGPGVTDEQLTHLRDRFYRVDHARTRATGGSGLGLSIVDAIINAHGGSLTAAHRRPTGLTITVRIPMWEELPPATGGRVVA